MMKGIRNDGWRGGRLGFREADCSFREGVHDEPYEKVTAEQKPDRDKGASHADVWGVGRHCRQKEQHVQRP